MSTSGQGDHKGVRTTQVGKPNRESLAPLYLLMSTFLTLWSFKMERLIHWLSVALVSIVLVASPIAASLNDITGVDVPAQVADGGGNPGICCG